MNSSNYLILIILLILFAISANSETNKKFVNKCCPKGKYVVNLDNNKTCVKPILINDRRLDFSQVPLYNDNKKKTGRNLPMVYELIDGEVISENFSESISDHHYYMSEIGVLYEESPNEYVWWTEWTRDKFCIDYSLSQNATVVLGPRVWLAYTFDIKQEPSIVYNIGFFISCIFLALIMVVYCLLPGSRVLSELIQMAYVASTLGAFLFVSVISISVYTVKTCIGLSYVTYFLLLSSFCWMDVMSYDLWSLHSNFYFGHRMSKREMLIKFKWYCLFGWGIPAVMTTFLVVANHVDLKHIPSFTKPNIPMYACFIEGGEKFLYLYIPMLILIVGNWIFYFLTSYCLWKQFKMTSVVDRSNTTQKNHRTLKNRLVMYLKLSIIMGITWILEVASFLKPDIGFWYVSDYYNMLIGLSMFLVLVCNKKTFKKLKKRFKSEGNVMPIERSAVDTENF